MNAIYPAVHMKAHEAVAEIVASLEKPGGWVLDCGAGDRHLANTMEAKGFRVVATDPRGGPGVVRAGWDAVPVRTDSLAAVTACASLHYAPNARHALAEVVRVLRPGGTFVAALSPVHATRTGALKGQKTARERTGNPEYQHFDLLGVRQVFAEAGLKLEIRPFRLPGAVGRIRRAKSAVGVELAQFPLLIAKKDRTT